MDRCAGENTLAGFLEGSLSREASVELQAHIARCSACRQLLVNLASAASLPIRDSANADIGPGSLSDEGEARAGTPPAQLDEYRIMGFLGQGTMGRVYLGHDTRLDRPVAIKFLAAASSDGHYRERLLIEARAVARIQHANVVSVYRVGEHERQLYLVSEFVRGQSLDRIDKPLPWPHALEIGIALTKGLGAAHAAGVLHRDIKPANAIMTVDGGVKLLDFGLAKLTELQDQQPDEQLDEQPPATDAEMSIRALAELRERVQREELPPLHKILAPQSLPPEFSAVVKRCLKPNPAERFASADELLAALLKVQGKRVRTRAAWPLALGLGFIGTLALLWQRQGAWSAPCSDAAPCAIDSACQRDSGRCVPASPGWQKLPPLPTPRGFTCAAYMQGAVFIFGGVLESNPRQGFRPPVSSVEKFDFATQKWSPATPMPAATLGSRCVSLKGKIYVIGGRVVSGAAESDNSNVVQIYDPLKNSWSAAARMHRLRSWFGAAVLHERIYVVGGVGQRAAEGENGYLDSAEVYDPAANTWTLLDAKLSAGRYMLGVSAYAEHLYAVGGTSFRIVAGAEREAEYKLIEELEADGGAFRPVGNLPEPISVLEIMPLNPKSLLLANTEHLFRMTVPDGKLAIIDKLPADVASHDAGLVMTPHGLFVAGGGGWGANRDQVYLYRFPPAISATAPRPAKLSPAPPS